MTPRSTSTDTGLMQPLLPELLRRWCAAIRRAIGKRLHAPRVPGACESSSSLRFVQHLRPAFLAGFFSQIGRAHV